MLKKRLKMMIGLSVIVLCITGCEKEKVPTPLEGKYISKDGNSFIELSNYKSNSSEEKIGECDIQFTNVDFSEFYDFTVNVTAANYIAVNYPDGCSKEERNDICEKIKSQMDMNKQFIDNPSKFEYFHSESEQGYGFMSEIEGSGFDGAYETYVTLEYRADEKAIICNEIKYVLEE